MFSIIFGVLLLVTVFVSTVLVVLALNAGVPNFTTKKNHDGTPSKNYFDQKSNSGYIAFFLSAILSPLIPIGIACILCLVPIRLKTDEGVCSGSIVDVSNEGYIWKTKQLIINCGLSGQGSGIQVRTAVFNITDAQYDALIDNVGKDINIKYEVFDNLPCYEGKANQLIVGYEIVN